jgi:hypothetical protein
MEQSLPLVSVIVPTHNRSGMLRVAVESALAQSYPRIEVIVVDDGSVDDTANVMSGYAGRITYLRQANQDVAVARNTGIEAATGEYLTFLDDDDWIIPAKIERQMRVMAFRPEVGLVHSRYWFADQGGALLSRVGLLPEGDVLQELLCGNLFWVGAPLVRRQCLDQVGAFDTQIPAVCADWDLWLRIVLAGYRVACVQEPLGVYRMQSTSMLAQVGELEKAALTILEKAFADPRLPAKALAVRDRAYSTWRLWIGCRYYAARRWTDGCRNLEAALAHCPDWLVCPIVLAKLLAADALSPRVTDPLLFIAGILDHLPAGAQVLADYRSRLLDLVHVGLALRAYGRHAADARDHLAQAIRLDPGILERQAEFADAVQDYALHLPGGESVQYAEHVLAHLPPEARPLAHVRAAVLSSVNVGQAFEDYAVGRWGSTVRRIWMALRHRPAWLANRGVVSILARSLVAYARTGRQAG